MADTWDASRPNSAENASLYPAEVTMNNRVIQAQVELEHQAMNSGKDGQHKFPVVATTVAGAEGRAQILNNVWTWYSNGAWRNAIPFPAGTKMLFAQASAPTGWTQDTSQNDRVLRVVSGAGAGTGGSWTISGLTTSNHTLTAAQMPSHTHTVNDTAIGSGSGLQGGGGFGTITVVQTSSSAGGGGAHNHGAVVADGVWRPAYFDVIVAEKG